MNLETDEIYAILKTHYKTRNVFIDCVPCDLIPTSDRYPYAVVVNTDVDGGKGRHWIAIYVRTPTTAEYFCSGGQPPRGHIKTYLDQFPNLKMSEDALQSPLTNVCGAYCVYFVINRCSGQSFDEIIRTLRRCPEADLKMCMYFYSLLPRCI